MLAYELSIPQQTFFLYNEDTEHSLSLAEMPGPWPPSFQIFDPETDVGPHALAKVVGGGILMPYIYIVYM